MKTIPSNIQTHLNGTTTTLALCWKVTAVDGTIKAYTSHPLDLVVSGVTYKSAYGFSPSAINTSSGLSVDNVDVQGILNVTGFYASDVLAGKWDFAAVQVFLVNYASLADGVVKLRTGTLGEVKLDRQGFTAELRGVFQMYAQQVGDLYSAGCRADLGDTKCQVNLATFTVTGTLTGVSSNRIFVDSSRTQADNYFQGGLLTWTGGANNGLSMEVKLWTLSSHTFELVLAMPNTVAIGDTYSVYAGCDKTLAKCLSPFNNVVNFRGEPYVPMDGQVAIARAADVSSGGK